MNKLQTLLAACLHAFNEIPNKKLSGGDYKNTYEIAAAIGQHQREEKENPPSFILCYTLRVLNSKKKEEFKNDDHIYTDYWQVFCEIDEQENTPEEQTNRHLLELKNVYEDERSKTELYTWSIARVIHTSEHYTT